MEKKRATRRGSLIAVACAGLAQLFAASAHATVITRQIGNNSFDRAQNLDPYFSLDFSPDIGDAQLPNNNTSLTIPHATVLGVDSEREFAWSDYYSFEVESVRSQVYLDIDYGFGDSRVWLYDADRTLLANNDDSRIEVGGLGSRTDLDPFLPAVVDPGLYYIRVSSWTGARVDGPYTLQVSVANHAVPEPGSLALFGLGIVALECARRLRLA